MTKAERIIGAILLVALGVGGFGMLFGLCLFLNNLSGHL